MARRAKYKVERWPSAERQRSRHSLTTFALVVAAWLGCGGSTTRMTESDAGSREGLRGALSELSQSNESTYSIMFNGDPSQDPSTIGLRFAVHLRAASAACGLYSAEVDESREDYWLLQVDLTGTGAGEYRVAVDGADPGAGGHGADVTLLHRRGGAYVEGYHAVGGRVTLAHDTGLAEWKNDDQLRASMTLEFPEHAVRTDSCRGGVDTAGHGTMQCTCIDSDGVKSECVPDNKGHCCVDVAGPRFSVALSVDAQQCQGMCRVVSGVSTNYCGSLF